MIVKSSPDTILKVNIIDAHRELDGYVPNSGISSQLHKYYYTYFNMDELPDEDKFDVRLS